MDRIDFMERLRRSLGTRSRPPRVLLELRCSAHQHPLLWIVPFDGGRVPVTKSGEREFRVEGVQGEDGTIRPLTLADLEGGDVLPIGKCPCGSFQGPTKNQVEDWIAQEFKDRLVAPEPR